MSGILIAPLEALTDNRLSDPERRVLLALFSFRGKATNTVWPSVEAIAERANIKDHTRVSKVTRALAEKGWLNKKKRGFTGCNEYSLTVPANLDTEANLASETNLDADTSSNLDSETKSNLDSDAKYKEETNEQTKEHKKTIALKPIASFDEFWDAYPRKDDKAKSAKAWARLKPTEQTLEAIKNHISAKLAAGDWDINQKKFIPLPTTFLNGERWNDEVRGDGYANNQRPNQPAKLTPAQRVRAKREAARQRQLAAESPALGAMGTDDGNVRPPVGIGAW